MSLTLRLVPQKLVRGRWITSGGKLIAAKVEGKEPIVGVISQAPSPTFFHTQSVASALWIINHNLDRFVDVVVTDLAGNNIGADISRISDNQTRIGFASPATGKAFFR